MNLDEMLHIRISEQLRDALENEGRKLGLTVSTYARFILMEWYRAQNGESDKVSESAKEAR